MGGHQQAGDTNLFDRANVRLNGDDDRGNTGFF
jgi:hypothetical protein